MHKLAVSLVVIIIALAGCAASVISDEKIRSSTAGVLGVDVSQVAIANRRSEVTNTYYIAKTTAGDEYACVISGSVLSAGMVNPPACTKK